MPRTIIDDFLDSLKQAAVTFAEDFVKHQIKPPRHSAPRARRVSGKAPKVRTPKTPKPAKRERQGPTLYEVLGVDARAEPEVIEAAWKAKARLYHPDRDKSASAVRKMAEINHAHDVLRVPMDRKLYDAKLKTETR